jgi:hypothetical protein
MSAAAAPTAPFERASTDRKPSARQVYAIAHLALDALEVDWPESRRDASELISRLSEVAPQKGSGGDDCPF